MDIKAKTIGMVGLGQMGGGMAVNLAKGGFKVTGFDLKPEACERLVQAGGTISESTESLVNECSVVMTCLEGKTALKVAESAVIPNITKGQLYIDSSTIAAPDARKLADAARQKGAGFLDAPVSGGFRGADAGTLRVFVGGKKEIYEQCVPLFHAVGNPEKVNWYGPAGMGQVAKDVQQMTERMPTAARLEVLAFGIRTGLSREQLLQALDETPSAPGPYSRLLEIVDAGDKHRLSPMAAEWEYYLAAASAAGMRMPMLEGVYEFLKDVPKKYQDNVHRPIACLWDELMKGSPLQNKIDRTAGDT